MGYFHDKTRYLILTVTVITLVHAYTNLLLFNFTVLCMKETQEISAIINGTEIIETQLVEIFKPEQKATLYSVVAIGMLTSVCFIMAIINKIGGRMTFTLYGFISGIATILLPICAKYSFAAVVCVRFLQGVGYGMSFVSVGYVSVNWSPMESRGLFLTVLTMFYQISSLTAAPSAGLFCTSEYGWQGMYFLQGTSTIIVFFIFFCVYTDHPRNNKFVTESEASYIEGPEPMMPNDRELPSIPYFEALTDPAIIGTLIVCLGDFVCFNVFTLFEPVYLNKVLGLDIAKTGFAVCVPYIGNLALKAIIGPLSDRLKIISPLNSVRMFMGISQFTMAFSFIGLAFIPSGYIHFALTLYVLAIIGSACNSVGYYKSLSFSCGVYTAKVMTWISFLNALVLFSLPIFKTIIASDDREEDWRIMFLSAAVIGIIAVIIYICTVRVDLRPWAQQLLKSRRPSISTICSISPPNLQTKSDKKLSINSLGSIVIKHL
jgi:ACS family sodium-dependent inorganic phosphate cotransporter-like MFS transporter 5